MAENKTNLDIQSDGASTTMAEVHSAWLTAGANGDVATMRLLKSRFPEWLDLQRVNVSLTQHSTFIQDVIPNLCHDAASETRLRLAAGVILASTLWVPQLFTLLLGKVS
ncbi:Hypothetical protein PHPALM_19006 [Phytophthora palmivora]|uniref:Uncharacterized protein n=1 Tax=Phytophthora palmivora TaxID=4796 RepID=A0A2P4XIC5_9STRA|nr:Hypothetical protein PHPALM_19006 [Phytophthora palmivora]